MKIKVMLTFIALSVSIMSPLSVNISPSAETPFIVILDVCHAAGSALGTDFDSPVVNEGTCQLYFRDFAGYFAILRPVSIMFLIAVEEDRPPNN
ncbi:MAG: hypothetical protein ACYC69_11735 [Thermodesulfovibrionales bacterium]